MWGALFQVLWAIIVPLAVRVLMGLGFSVVVFGGVQLGMTALKNELFARFSGIDSVLVKFLYILQFDKGIAILFAAMTLNLYIKTYLGSFSRGAWNKPGPFKA